MLAVSHCIFAARCDGWKCQAARCMGTGQGRAVARQEEAGRHQRAGRSQHRHRRHLCWTWSWVRVPGDVGCRSVCCGGAEVSQCQPWAGPRLTLQRCPRSCRLQKVPQSSALLLPRWPRVVRACPGDASCKAPISLSFLEFVIPLPQVPETKLSGASWAAASPPMCPCSSRM